MGRRIFASPDEPEQRPAPPIDTGVPESWLPASASSRQPIRPDPLAHARNAEAELRSVLRTVKSNDVRSAVQFALEAWEERIRDLEDAQPTP